MADDTENLEDLIPDEGDRPSKVNKDKMQPLYQIYEGARLPVGKAVGPMFKKRLDAALHAYSVITDVWQQCFMYYNHDQTKQIDTPQGVFKRGDGSENVIHSTINITLPAIYSKNPDVSCSTTDGEDEPFCKALQALLNALLRRQDALNAKSKVKRSCGLALLTNFGILKLDFTMKDDSREHAITEMERLTNELKTVKTQEAVERIWGEFEALEMNMEARKPSGFGLGNVLPHNLIVDPYAEQSSGDDAGWMIERVWLPTGMLTARYTKKGEDDNEGSRVLVYKPTHKAQIGGDPARDDGLGMVMSALSDSESTSAVTAHTDDERRAYLEMYYTECYFVWDKVFRRVYLFHRDDWAWPLWVWDDPLKTTRFFPYFFVSFSFSTGGMITVGDTAFVLDQQDHINDINRQAARIRRSIFNYFFYDSEKFDQAEIEKFISAIRGETTQQQHAIGVKNSGDKPVKDAIEAFAPPAYNFKDLFDKQPLFDGINRQTNTSDAIRGVQFKTNTNVEAVNTYQQSMQLSIGSKVDAVEDCMTDLCFSIAEIAVQNYDQATVEGYVGKKLAAGWQQMDINTFRSTYSLEITPGSMEKPTSVFKKKEAIEITQAVGQFATAAPGTTLMIMLKVLSKAFTDVVIKQDDWDALAAEVQAQLQRGNSTGESAGDPNAGADQDTAAAANSLPPEIKQKLMELGESGATDEQMAAAIQEAVAQYGQGGQGNQQQQAGAANGVRR